MRLLRSGVALALFTGVALGGAGATGCSAAEEEAGWSPDALRSDPSASVPTIDPGVHLLGGYNAFLDRASPNDCVERQEDVQPDVGATDGSFYLRHVKSREELAKELDVDINASLTMPQGSVDATTKIVKSFKQSSTTVTFLVRSFRSYTVTNHAPLQLSEKGRDIIARGDVKEILVKCGGSFAQTVKYEAEVVALMQFEAQTVESAQNIRSSFGGSANVPVGGSAKAQLQSKAEQTASSNNASLSLTVMASGFVSNAQTAGDLVEGTFQKIDDLRAEMAASWDRDIAADRNDYFGHRNRNVKPVVVGQASYAAIADAPEDTNYGELTTTLARAEEFVNGIAPVYLRMEAVHNDEVKRFLSDQNNQYRYNLAVAPKLKTGDLVPIAQNWAAKFGPDGSRQNGSLVAPLRMAIERCMSSASASGDYDACTPDQIIDRDKSNAEEALAKYAREGRIVPVTAWMPQLGREMSYRNANDECLAASMRLPKREEMAYIAPAVTALTGDRGEAWFAADGTCGKPYFANGSGQGVYGCADSFVEGLPWYEDRPVVCVGRGGPVVALSAP